MIDYYRLFVSTLVWDRLEKYIYQVQTPNFNYPYIFIKYLYEVNFKLIKKKSSLFDIKIYAC